ncbi:uncharacterized protein LOC144111346 [Amblyomma americanum]
MESNTASPKATKPSRKAKCARPHKSSRSNKQARREKPEQAIEGNDVQSKQSEKSTSTPKRTGSPWLQKALPGNPKPKSGTSTAAATSSVMTGGGSKSAQESRPPTAGSLNYAQHESALLPPGSAPQVPRDRTDAKTDAASSSADQERQLGEHEMLDRDKAEIRELLDEGRHQGAHEEAQDQLDGAPDNKCKASPDESNAMQPNYRPTGDEANTQT